MYHNRNLDWIFYFPVFTCIPNVFLCISLYSLVFSCIPLYSLVFPWIFLYCLVFSYILLYSPVFPCILLYSLVFSRISLSLQSPLNYTCQLSRLTRESHAYGLKTSISRRLTLAGQFLMPDWKMWVVAVLLDTMYKNRLSKTHAEGTKTMCKMNKWQYLPRDLWFFKSTGSELVFIRVLRLQKTSGVFGRLRTCSGIFVNDHVVFKNPSTPRVYCIPLYTLAMRFWSFYVKKRNIN